MSSGSASSSATVRFASQSAFTFGGYAFTFLAGFPFQIYVAQTIGASGLGVFSIADSVTQIVANFLSLGIAPAMVRFVPAYREAGKVSELRRILMTGAIALALAGTLGWALTSAFVVVADLWASQWIANRDVFLVMAIGVPVGLLLNFAVECLRGFHDFRTIVLGNSVVQLAIKIVVAIVLFSFGWREVGLAWANVAGSVVALICLAEGVRRHWRRVRDNTIPDVSVKTPDEWRQYARILYVGSLIGVIAAPADRFLLGSLVGSAAVGIFVAVMSLQNVTGIAQQMMLTVAAPLFAELQASVAGKEKVQHLFHVCTDWGVRVSLPLVISFAFFADRILEMYGHEFALVGTIPLWIVLAAQVCNIACGPGGKLLVMIGYEKLLFRFYLYQVSMFLVLLALLVPLGGVHGAAIATALNILISNAMALWVLKQRAGITWFSRRYRRWLLPTLVLIVICILVRPFIHQLNMIRLIGVMAGACLVFHSIYFLSGLEAEDQEVWLATKRRFGWTKEPE